MSFTLPIRFHANPEGVHIYFLADPVLWYCMRTDKYYRSSEIKALRTCDYSPKEGRTNWSCARDQIVAGAFHPVEGDSTEYSIESYSALKIFVTVKNIPQKPHTFLWLSPDSS